jgi:hypothetical protein
MAKNMPLIERFFQKVDKSGSEAHPDCWIWKGGKTSSGYGSFKYYQERSAIGSHVSSYLFHIGEVPKGMFVCHHCDNPPCVNPEHLFLDTNSGNMKDMFKKGRNGSSTKKQTQCRRGHSFEEFEPLIYVKKQGRQIGKEYRTCKECKRINDSKRRGDNLEYMREYNLKNKEKLNEQQRNLYHARKNKQNP